ncbi:hypothetical protein DPMN_190475 [Dreissena polymorpha]|uniref:Uncharacterized protein n=1 Tax=Dreissena polymorpha TaxID=45954 RepID=A0A9D4DW07_DREPO|nr:hypothetical protein DPMN_190475 [Dreissena polymorpha]
MGAAHSLLYGELDPSLMMKQFENAQIQDTEIHYPGTHSSCDATDTNENIANDTNGSMFVRNCETVLKRFHNGDTVRHEHWLKLSTQEFCDVVVQKETCCSNLLKSEIIMCIQEQCCRMNTGS